MKQKTIITILLSFQIGLAGSFIVSILQRITKKPEELVGRITWKRSERDNDDYLFQRMQEIVSIQKSYLDSYHEHLKGYLVENITILLIGFGVSRSVNKLNSNRQKNNQQNTSLRRDGHLQIRSH